MGSVNYYPSIYFMVRSLSVKYIVYDIIVELRQIPRDIVVVGVL